MTERRSTPEDIGGRLRRLRGDMGLNEFATELGVAREDYIAYETGKREVPASLLIALIERGRIDPAWVLTGQQVNAAAGSAKTARIAYAAILEAAQRAGETLTPPAFAYGGRRFRDGVVIHSQANDCSC